MHTEKGNGEHPPEEPLRPGVSNEFLRRHGIRHVNDSEAEVLIGRRQSGLAIPYRSITDPELKVNGRHFHRIRVDRSTDKMKYLSPTGCGVQLYIPQDITLGPELVIAEGEFKCLAAAEEGISAVGIGGICSMMPEESCSRNSEQSSPNTGMLRALSSILKARTSLNGPRFSFHPGCQQHRFTHSSPWDMAVAFNPADEGEFYTQTLGNNKYLVNYHVIPLGETTPPPGFKATENRAFEANMWQNLQLLYERAKRRSRRSILPRRQLYAMLYSIPRQGIVDWWIAQQGWHCHGREAG
jgi:hypothetical protein